MDFHPLADIWPLIEGPEFEDFVADVEAHGLREPIWIIHGADGPLVLDGRNRYRACERLGIEPKTRTYEGDDPLAFVLSMNEQRRHESESQRALVAARIANLQHGQRADLAGRPANLPVLKEEGEPDKPVAPVSQAEAANLMKVSERSVRSARRVIEKGTPEIVRAVEKGEVAVSAAAEVVKLQPDVQREVAKLPPAEIKEVAKFVKAEPEVVRAPTRMAQIIAEAAENALKRNGGAANSRRNPYHVPPTPEASAWQHVFGTMRAFAEWATPENIDLAIRGMKADPSQEMNLEAVQEGFDALTRVMEMIDA